MEKTPFKKSVHLKLRSAFVKDTHVKTNTQRDRTVYMSLCDSLNAY